MKVLQRILAGRGVIVAGIIGLVILGLLIDRERSLGGIAWTLITAYGLYNFGLWLAGPYLLPINPDRESKAFARHLLRRFAGGQKPLMAVVREGKVLPGPGGKLRDDAQGEGAILVDSTSVVVLVTDTGLSRIKGSGVHFTRGGEKIGAVVDLRPQVRSQDKDKYVEAQTRDGIWIKFKVSVRFQVDGTVAQKVQDADRSKVPWPEPYTWSQHAVTSALGHTRVGVDQNQTERWDDRALNEAIKRVRTAIAGYTFDGLTEPRDPRVNPREDIRKKLEDDLKAEMAGKGIKVLGVGLSQFVPRDKEVIEQRIKSWQADWVRRQRIIEAEGLAESYRLVELARAQGQMELVLRIAQALEVSQQLGSENAEQMALRLLEVVERLAAQPGVGRRLSGESREALDQAHRKLLEKGSPGDGAASS